MFTVFPFERKIGKSHNIFSTKMPLLITTKQSVQCQLLSATATVHVNHNKNEKKHTNKYIVLISLNEKKCYRSINNSHYRSIYSAVLSHLFPYLSTIIICWISVCVILQIQLYTVFFFYFRYQNAIYVEKKKNTWFVVCIEVHNQICMICICSVCLIFLS